MKKFFALLLTLAMALSLVACGSSNNGGSDASNDGGSASGEKVIKMSTPTPLLPPWRSAARSTRWSW